MVFGRHPNCEIVLDNAAVSRHHAQILANHGNYYLEDLRSRNGTHLNGMAIEGRTQLHESDEVKVCDFVFRFHLHAPPDSDVVVKRNLGVTVPRSDHLKRTAPEQTISPEVVLGNLAFTDDSEHSSIITTLEAKSSSGLRLSVNPEVKLRAVLEISTALGSVLDLNEVLTKILDGLFKVFPQADEGFILLKDPETEKLVVRATKHRSVHDDSIPLSMTIVRQAMDSCEAILSANAAADSRFDASESLSNLRIRSMICAPLVSQDGTALGVIQLSTRDLRLQFHQDDLDVLVSVASQGCLAIENAYLHQALLRKRDLDRELEFATQVQLGFLPHERPKLNGYEFYDYYEAAQSVGGDYFDYIPLPDGRIAVALADVAGKGVPAALLMARLYSSARFHILTQASIGEALAGLNGEIASSGLGHRFITCVLAIIDPEKHEMMMANAGHLPPMLRDAHGRVEPMARKESGMPLGIVPDQKFRELKYKLERGDAWVFYTDGVTEAMRSDKQIYGGPRLADFISQGPAAVERLVKGIVEDVERFCAGEAQRDDMCLVGFRRTR